jgi:hypothetical protein
VKCYTKVGSVSNFNELKQEAADQLQHSESALRRHFEFLERPDRLLKTRELATLLNFYLDRSLRYELIDEESAKEARILLATLEEGYSLEFTRSGLIFDFEKQGTEPPEYKHGIEFHRIGIDLMEALMALAKPVSGVEKASTSEIPQEQNIEFEKDLIPRLTSAAFIVAPRERSTSWDELIPEEDPGAAPAKEQADVLIPTASQELDSVAQSPSLDLEVETRKKQPNISSLTKPQQENEQQDASTSSGLIASKPQDEPVSPAPSEVKADEALQTELDYDIMLGVQSQTPQYGILGEVSGRKVALDLNQTHTISLFGVQGAGKSYTLGSIVEMACLPIPNINVLPSPLTTIIFQYSPTQDYKPEFTSMVKPNSEASQLEVLRERYGAELAALNDVLIFVPPSKVEERKAEYPDIEVLPITFAASELKAMHWRFLMGAVGSQSMYLRQINLIMRKLRDELTLEGLLQGIQSSSLSDHLKDLARTRLDFAAEYIDDSRRLSDLILPGRLAIVDLRDEFIEKDEALGLFVVLLQICSEATDQGRPFNKFVVFDEAHKYVENADLVAGLIEIVREMRHKGTSIMVASQDPPSVPVSLIELSSHIILH